MPQSFSQGTLRAWAAIGYGVPRLGDGASERAKAGTFNPGRRPAASALKPALKPWPLSFLSLVCLCGFAGQAQPAALTAGNLQVIFQHSAGGIALASVSDTKQDQEFLAEQGGGSPLFTVVLHHLYSTNVARLNADAGWGRSSVKRSGPRLQLHWGQPSDDALAGLSVTATATSDAANGALHWKLRVDNNTANWSVWQVIFPQLALADLGTNAAVLLQRGPGELQRGVWAREFGYRGTYPSSAWAMQFLAVYRENSEPTGLYWAIHDPWGSTKDFALKSDPATHSLRLSVEHPAPNMGQSANGFALEGQAVWQLLRGNWFDAARIYRGWAQREAKWWPRLGPIGREDTPRWMRQLNVWAMTGGAPADCVPKVKQFRDFLGLPAGFHWYNWHQIPFDNDYPHYFPAKDGFVQGVAELKSAEVFPMPYINGRLWDSHDRGAEDFQFTSVALAAVTKKEDGTPFVETYGSKETNGQPVRLGVMCPATALWQGTVNGIVRQLLRDCGTSAVYIDQVAAAAPKLCLDRTHGHPWGGGHWWNEGYWKMLDTLRRAKPRETVLTTECNSEPFIRWFDGYLTWHWQYDGQVPAFPAVYGGTIQMFGRAYRGGATKDLALRMKAGQQLVFGEQLGWLDPTVVKETENAEFFRQMVQMRAKFNRYFSFGEMARPPKFLTQVPRVKADWQWSGEWWVTTDAVLTGAWRLPGEHRVVLLFVNVTDEPVTAAVWPDAVGWGLPPGQVRCEIVSNPPSIPTQQIGGLGAPTTFGPRQAQAWELKW